MLVHACILLSLPYALIKQPQKGNKLSPLTSMCVSRVTRRSFAGVPRGTCSQQGSVRAVKEALASVQAGAQALGGAELTRPRPGEAWTLQHA